ncbi:DNA-binding HxlR family transcriptional regulator [Hamadaea flava]|uniref:Winged helix-turn-helix transcriptional regulator n=1 Tax=Hamadaea flava TaxID=1742688 RepID=A0ABV8LSY5_9ACTN|nr:helix-turn-helix domain-containing protein [Hamadaea flava]MCP2328309.1 DNA-binding HxlR family transcriptional regulator [Hamadaea flava]
MGRDDCYDFVSDCRIRLVTDLLSHSWDPVVLVALRIGPQRRSALITAIGDVSDKALTESLRRLAARGLVTRTSESTVRKVEYALTAVGESLVHGPLATLGQWALDHGDELMAPAAV